MTHRLVVTKLWINGRASEDRDEWTEEVRAHCEKCYDDKMETSEVQAERNPSPKKSWRQLSCSPGRLDWVFRARGKMMKNKANGPADCPVDGDAAVFADGDRVRDGVLVREAVQRGVSGPGGVENSSPCVSQKRQTLSFRKDYVAISPFSVFSKWYTTVLVDLLHEEKEPLEWRSLHVGAERGFNQLRAHAGLVDEYTTETLGVAGQSPNRFATRVLQVLHGPYDELGRESGVRRGQNRSGIKDSHFDRSPWTRGGSLAGRDAGRSFGLLQEL